ncbi:unnamed protein product [Rotaria magnacalcarata]|uniref:Uncharacterized protein n=1 Tax=Rotaria magnacalcarata TaxID=392030 RepID=A0A816ZCS9_9BILA|nr:unnamed protein product [Rotaria magnacalcarata]CAF1637999.1 unnamed protein product [Rotaria magnacalcarata]CAF1924047.1 unnamed protein product [Rotaria magnacalcarata]CAF1927415.1 unnamed protein product [Rotaria magnacalcarata]CAF2198743.1 unnamed protein product [Rotaria magnacalcarata]
MQEEIESNNTFLLPIESQDHFDLFIEITSTPKTKFIQPTASTPIKKSCSSSSSTHSNNNNNHHHHNMNNNTRTSIRPRLTLKRTYCKSAIFFRQLKRTFL